jgi:hypothetical protein
VSRTVGERTVGALDGYELSVGQVVEAGEVVTVELSETVDVPDGRRRTHEAVVFDVGGGRPDWASGGLPVKGGGGGRFVDA